MARYAFAFSPLALPLRLAGIGPDTASVEVVDGRLDVAFGPWRLQTAVSNVAAAEVTGPYNPLLALGVRVSVRERDLTFGTTTAPGLAITFHEPVAGAVPFGLLRHPALTVTVADPRALRRELVGQADGVDGSGPRLLEAVSGPRVASRPVMERPEESQARRARVRSAKKAAVSRAAHRAEAEREHQAELARRREARAARKAQEQPDGAAGRRRAAERASSGDGEQPATSPSRTAGRSTSQGAATRTPAQRTPGKRATTQRTPATRTSATRTPAKRAAAERTPATRTPAKRTPAKRTSAERSPAAPTTTARTTEQAPTTGA